MADTQPTPEPEQNDDDDTVEYEDEVNPDENTLEYYSTLAVYFSRNPSTKKSRNNYPKIATEDFEMLDHAIADAE